MPKPMFSFPWTFRPPLIRPPKGVDVGAQRGDMSFAVGAGVGRAEFARADRHARADTPGVLLRAIPLVLVPNAVDLRDLEVPRRADIRDLELGAGQRPRGRAGLGLAVRAGDVERTRRPAEPSARVLVAAGAGGALAEPVHELAVQAAQAAGQEVLDRIVRARDRTHTRPQRAGKVEGLAEAVRAVDVEEDPVPERRVVVAAEADLTPLAHQADGRKIGRA